MTDTIQHTQQLSSLKDRENNEQCVVISSTCEESEHCRARCAAYGKVCPRHARAAGKAVCKRVQNILSDSCLFASGEPSFHRLERSDIARGKRLGEGGFSLVETCEVVGVDPTKKLAIKYLKRPIMVQLETFVCGASDLVNEALFLGRLNHPNIIQLYGITEGDFEQNVSTARDAGFFIVLDQLVETLDQRLDNWLAHTQSLSSNIFRRMSKSYKRAQRMALMQRLEVARDIAKVMQYLHSLDYSLP